MQQPQSQKQGDPHLKTRITPLRAAHQVVHINTFGAFLRYLREREQLQQQEVSGTFPEVFQTYHVPVLTADMYRKLERGKRAPQFEELFPLYVSFTAGNGMLLSPEERRTFVRLARLKIEALQRRRPPLRPESEWRLLEVQLAQFDQGILLEDDTKDSERAKRLSVPTRNTRTLDTSHIVGRETWNTEMLSYLEAAKAPKKLVVIQGMMGAGKTSSLKLLLRSVLEHDEYWPILYTFSPASDMTPDDHLDSFLATILAEVHAAEPEAPKTPPLTQRIEQVLTQLSEAEQRIVVLVDDAQVILDEHGQLPENWRRFLTAFLQHQHRALIYMATREWPLWTGRERAFVVDGDKIMLPPLDPKAGAEIWRRLGFTDVAEGHLQQAAERCGGNALMIEWRAASLQRPRFSFSWKRRTEPPSSQEKKSEHQQLIERLLADPHVFGAADVEARQLLQQVISRRLSYDAVQLLEVLSASPLALPFPLLADLNQQVEYALVELLKASLVDGNAIGLDERAYLQPLVREAGVQKLLLEERLDEVERHLTRMYGVWLEQGTFQSEQEQAALVAELAILSLKQHRLLEAAELLIEYGWLSFAFGHAARLARVTDEIMRSFPWHLSAEHEAGGQLLHYYLLARFLDKDLGTPERKKAYLHLYEAMRNGSVAFKPRTMVHLVHHKLRYLITAKKYDEARLLIDEVCSQYEYLRETRPTTYTELLDRRAYVLGRWGDFQDAQAKKEQDKAEATKLREEAFRLRQEAVTVHEQCIALLRQYEFFASPIEQSHIRFKRARLLNDLAYYQRCTGHLEEARQAMKECLKLKEAGFVWVNSLAVSYGDYAQLLGQLGNYQEALAYSDRALQIVQKLIDDGESASYEEKGMQLIDKGKLLLLLGQLDEAKSLFEEGARLVKGTSREVYMPDAEEGLRLIEVWHRVNPRHQLDWRWFTRYRQLVSYDDIAWLAQAGPFTEDERREWDSLIDRRDDEHIAKRLSAIVVQSRKRELAACLEEQREPQFHYPLIPCLEVQTRLAELSQLRIEIERDEPNVIVRRLYLAAIDERLDELKLVDATSRGNDDDFSMYNQRLFSPPTPAEMQIALSQLFHRIEQGRDRAETQNVSRWLLQQLQQWHLAPVDYGLTDVGCVREAMTNEEASLSTVNGIQKMFSPQTVQRFFEDTFRNYQFDWTVVFDEASTSERVDLNQHRLILSERPMSNEKVRELLAHEIEVHTFRSSSGAHSPLAILSSGLQGFLETEEGLAMVYSQEAVRQASGIKPKPKIWIGTLTCGLASGVVCPPLTFRKLLLFVEAVSMLIDLLDGKESSITRVREKARRYAQNRCLRTYRGVTHLERSGICTNKDAHYLRGFLAVCQEVEKDPTVFDQLMVGSIGLHHRTDLAELGISVPGVVHKRFAIDPDLDAYIMQFADGRV